MNAQNYEIVLGILRQYLLEVTQNPAFPIMRVDDPCDIALTAVDANTVHARLEKRGYEKNSVERRSFHNRLNRHLYNRLARGGIWGVARNWGIVYGVPVFFVDEVLDCGDHYMLSILVAHPANIQIFVPYVRQRSKTINA